MKNYHAIVLCAGFGTRLRPFTEILSKTVAPLGEWPVSFYTIKALLDAGATQVHCNTHYLAELVEAELMAALLAAGYEKNCLRFWREESILETGGGITNIIKTLCDENPENMTKDTFVASGDVFAQLPLEEMQEAWKNRSQKAKALMVTKPLLTPRKDATWIRREGTQGNVVGFGSDCSPDDKVEGRIFTTLQILATKEILATEVIKRSSVDHFYRPIILRGDEVINLDSSQSALWFDIGNYKDYALCLRTLNENHFIKKNLPKHCYMLKQNPTVETQKTAEVPNPDDFLTAFLSSNAYSLHLIALPESLFSCVNRVRTPILLKNSASLSLLTALPHQPNTLSSFLDDSPFLSLLPDALLFSLPHHSHSNLDFPILLPLEFLLTFNISQPIEHFYSTSQTFILFS